MAEKKKENFGRKLQKAGRNFGNGFRSLFGLEEKPSLGSHENIDRLDKNFQPQQKIHSALLLHQEGRQKYWMPN